MTLLADGKYKKVIASQVRRYSHSWNIFGTPLPTEELESAAYEICAKALNTFDPTRGAAFPTYLHHRLGCLRDVAAKEQRRILQKVDGIKQLCSVGSVVELEESIAQANAPGTFRQSNRVNELLRTIRKIVAGIHHSGEADGLYLGDLSEDAQHLVGFLLERGMRRGAAPTASSIRKAIGWALPRTEDAWEEVGVWVKMNGKPYIQEEVTCFACPSGPYLPRGGTNDPDGEGELVGLATTETGAQ